MVPAVVAPPVVTDVSVVPLVMLVEPSLPTVVVVVVVGPPLVP